jgi:hypothetical protein
MCVKEVMAHDGQNPGAHIGPLSEEAPEAQGFLAGILNQVHRLLPIVSELVGVATERGELGDKIGFKGYASRRIVTFNRH